MTLDIFMKNAVAKLTKPMYSAFIYKIYKLSYNELWVCINAIVVLQNSTNQNVVQNAYVYLMMKLQPHIIQTILPDNNYPYIPVT